VVVGGGITVGADRQATFFFNGPGGSDSSRTSDVSLLTNNLDNGPALSCAPLRSNFGHREALAPIFRC
jgi:hypothetical protein